MYAFKCGDDSKEKLLGVSNSQNILNLKNITSLYLMENIKKIVMIILLDQLIKKCIFNK